MQEPIRKVTAQHAQDVIQSVFGVIKTISSPISPSVDNRSWKLIINGLNAPHKNRFVKSIEKDADRTHRFNPQEKRWKERTPHPKRGRDKQTEFTKKTSLTLVPPQGNIKLFAPRYGTPIGLLFDWRLCHRKRDRYVFSHNIVSDNKPWLWRKSLSAQEQKRPQGIAFEKLQRQLRRLAPHEVAEQNELMGGLHREAVIAVVAPENTLFIRINALAKKNLMLQEANMDLPILIFDRQLGIVEYTRRMQQEDVTEILQHNYSAEIKTLAKSCLNTYEQLPILQPNSQRNTPSAPPLHLLLPDPIGAPEIYALEGKPEQGTWGEWELKYRDVGFHFRRNALFNALDTKNLGEHQELMAAYPQLAAITLDTLQEVYSFALKHAGSDKYKLRVDAKDLSKKWAAFVKIAPQELCLGTNIDPILKKPTLFAMLDAINLTTTLEGIHENYARFAHSPWINVRRNPKWDNFCTLFHPKRTRGCPAYPNSQQKVIFALQKRAFEILSGSNYSNADVQDLLNSPLFDQEHIRRGVSAEIYTGLARLTLKDNNSIRRL